MICSFPVSKQPPKTSRLLLGHGDCVLSVAEVSRSNSFAHTYLSILCQPRCVIARCAGTPDACERRGMPERHVSICLSIQAIFFRTKSSRFLHQQRPQLRTGNIDSLPVETLQDVGQPTDYLDKLVLPHYCDLLCIWSSSSTLPTLLPSSCKVSRSSRRSM